MTENNIDRRQLIKTAAKAGVSIAAAVVTAALLYDKQGPKVGIDTGKLVTYPDFSIPQRCLFRHACRED